MLAERVIADDRLTEERVTDRKSGIDRRVQYAYDGNGNISSLETKAGDNVLFSFAYQYDGNGNRTAKAGTQAGLGGITIGNNVLDVSYDYDVR